MHHSWARGENLKSLKTKLYITTVVTEVVTPTSLNRFIGYENFKLTESAYSEFFVKNNLYNESIKVMILK